MTLLDHRGKPTSSGNFKKGAQPQTGEAFAIYGDRAKVVANLPMGGVVQFDLDNLTTHDFRAMRSHYQVNASLSVLSFMQHQSDWHVVCDGPGGKKIAEECELQLRAMWTPLNRAMSHANWAGYSPSILQWKNDMVGKGRTYLDKIKDLVPESAEVNWKEVDAWVPKGYDGNIKHVKVSIYDGIKQLGAPWPTPVENTLWYPLLSEHGSYKGRQLLKAAFTSWYFSILIHLFANRYYERFGEPIVVGRAPFEEDLNLPGGGGRVNGVEYMLRTISDLRSRSVVTLPNDTSTMGEGNKAIYDYDLEYLESQMRGADWERYLTRLDEEISIGLFTPILLMRTADVGSYNLGVGHLQMYLWMMNAMNDDRAMYIDKYILSRIADYNFSPNSPRPHIKFRKLGNQNAEIIKSIVDSMASKGTLGVDITELGEIAGLTLTEVKQTLQEEEPIEDPDDDDGGDNPKADKSKATDGLASSTPRATTKKITARVAGQVASEYNKLRTLEHLELDPGHERKLAHDLMYARVEDPLTAARTILGQAMEWAEEARTLYTDPKAFSQDFGKVLEIELSEYVPA